MPTCMKCHTTFPNRIMVDGKLRTVGNRKFCLTCSPFGGNGKGLMARTLGKKLCTACKDWKPFSEFYTRKSGYPHSYCKACLKAKSVQYLQDIKTLCVEYKGGHCVLCGYNACYAALDFHHLNPKEEDVCIARNRKNFEKIKPELDKCILVCSNCHREIHHGVKQIPQPCLIVKPSTN